MSTNVISNIHSSPEVLAFKMLIAVHVLLAEPAVLQMKEVSHH